MEFTWYGNENRPLKKTLLASKNIDYFKQLLNSYNKESVIFKKKVTIPDKALEASLVWLSCSKVLSSRVNELKN